MSEADERSDNELLQGFANQSDETAFTVLVRRHSGMVMTACRRILGNTQDAEDAFQAVFLALAKEASKLTRHPAIGAWLHRVACGTAIDACRKRKTRETKEKEAATMQEEIGEPSQVTEETGALLHAELNSLPERYRRSLIMFHIEGQSIETAAHRLARPVGTVKTWLQRGREKLRGRLVRKGVAFSIAGIGAALSAESAAAGVADVLVVSTAKTAAAMVGGKLAVAACSGLSANVAAMTKGALKMIFMAKVKVACLVGSGVILAGATTAVVAEKAVEARRETEENRAKVASVTWEKFDEKPSNRYPVRLGRKVGYMDREGKLVIAPEYAAGSAFRCGRATVYASWDTNGTSCVDQRCIDTTGREVEALSLATLSNSVPFKTVNISLQGFREGLATVTCQLDMITTQQVGTATGHWMNYRYGYVDTDGRWVIPPTLAHAGSFRDGRAVVRDTNGVEGIVDRSGRMTLTVPPDFMAPDNRGQGEGFLSIRQKSSPQGTGYVTEDGYRIPCRFWQALRFSEGLAAVAPSPSPVEHWRYIGKSGEYAFEGEFKNAHPFFEGLACVQSPQGKWGCIGRTGNTVVPCIYDGFGIRTVDVVDETEYVSGFADGLLAVRIGKQWSFINRDNKPVVPIEFSYAEGPIEGLCRVGRTFYGRKGEQGVRTGLRKSDGEYSQPLWFDSYYDATGKLVFDGLAKAVEMGIVVMASQASQASSGKVEGGKQTGDIADLDTVQTRFTRAAMQLQEAENLMKEATPDREKIGTLLVGPRKPGGARDLKEGAMYNFYEILVNYPQTPWAPQARKNAKIVKKMLEDLGAEQHHDPRREVEMQSSWSVGRVASRGVRVIFLPSPCHPSTLRLPEPVSGQIPFSM